ncbi:MAG: alpha-glucosidase [Clostridia bacterium]|nr:alpha-glucosidase [Clostridia bacterium]
MKKTWWKEAVVYQIYPKSFQDSNGDGIGDLQGILRRLDYIQSLGATVIWLNPIYASPQVDNGYDISDYQAINPAFGTLDDFKQLLDGAHRRGIRVIMDMVLNHTSDKHRWFQESRKSKDNPYRDFYIWRPARDGKEPNNWGNYFYEDRGSAWEWDEATQEYYLHNYSKKMPDLNWDCPSMRQEIYKMLRWWCDLGIDGFRLDAINRLQKPQGLPDSPRPCAPPVNPYGYIVDREMCANQPGIHELLKELNREVFSRYDIMTVGETGNLTSIKALPYVSESSREINMVFHFEIAKNPHLVTPAEYKDIQKRWADVIRQGGWGTQYLTNHDSPRQISRFGDDGELRVPSGKMLAMLTHTQPGTVYVYQGEEIGMINVDFPSIDYYDERYTLGKYQSMVEQGADPKAALDSLKMMSRDNVRTPMQWNDGKNAGFSEADPWLHVNPTYRAINVRAAEQDPDSILYTYRRLISLRKRHPVMVYGDYVPVMEAYENVVAYTREYGDEKWFMLFNFQKETQQVVFPPWLHPESAGLIMGNYPAPNDPSVLQPYEGRIYRLR